MNCRALMLVRGFAASGSCSLFLLSPIRRRFAVPDDIPQTQDVIGNLGSSFPD